MSAQTARRSGAFPTALARRRWWVTYLGLTALALLFAAGLLIWKNPVCSVLGKSPMPRRYIYKHITLS